MPDVLMSDVMAIAREYFPAWSDEDLGFVIWNETAFPFNLARDGREEALRKQLAELQARLARNPHYVLGGQCDEVA